VAKKWPKGHRLKVRKVRELSGDYVCDACGDDVGDFDSERMALCKRCDFSVCDYCLGRWWYLCHLCDTRELRAARPTVADWVQELRA
jgi:hypothetical protein